MPLVYRLLLAACSGLAVAIAFPPWNLWFAAPIALAVLAGCAAKNLRLAFSCGFLHALVFFLIHLQWAHHAVGPIPWVALSAMEALLMAGGVFGWRLACRFRLARPKLVQGLLFGLLWVGAEELRSRFPFGGFPWGRIAFSQLDAPMSRLAFLGGAPLVSLSVAVVAGLLWCAFAKPTFLRAVIPLSVAAAIGSVGLLLPLASAPSADTLHIGAVQGNVPDRGLNSFDQAREVLQNHLTETQALAANHHGDLDLVVWAENSSDVNPQQDHLAGKQLDRVSQALDAPILLGTLDYPAAGGRYNRAMLWQAGSGAIAHYDKQRPAAFAEYIPLRSIARFFSDAVDLVQTDMIAGDKVATISLPSKRLHRNVTVGDVICFEVAYDAIVRQSIQAGGEVLVVQTNNATFGRTPESLQQLAMSRLRAIETGRTTIQISTVGVSGAIAPDGTVTAQTAHFEPANFVVNAPLRTDLTPAMRFGSVIAWILALAATASVGLGIFFPHKR